MVKGEAAGLTWVMVPDKMFAWWGLVSLVFGSLSKPSMELLVNRLGDLYNAIGCYFFVRCLIVDFQDVVVSVRTLAFLSLPLAVLMMVEKTTTHNLLSIFGGVPAITGVREGHLRCRGLSNIPSWQAPSGLPCSRCSWRVVIAIEGLVGCTP